MCETQNESHHSRALPGVTVQCSGTVTVGGVTVYGVTVGIVTVQCSALQTRESQSQSLVLAMNSAARLLAQRLKLGGSPALLLQHGALQL